MREQILQDKMFCPFKMKIWFSSLIPAKFTNTRVKSLNEKQFSIHKIHFQNVNFYERFRREDTKNFTIIRHEIALNLVLCSTEINFSQKARKQFQLKQ